MQKIKGIIYDFDDTLCRTLPLHCKAYQETFKFYNLDLTEETYYKNIGQTANHTIPLFLGNQKSPVSIEELHQKKIEISLQLLEDFPIELLPPSNLLFLDGNFKFGIASAGTKLFMMPILKKYKLTKYFDCILDNSSVKNGKPAPDQLLLAAEMMNLTPEQCFYIGDSWADEKAAEAANMRFWKV